MLHNTMDRLSNHGLTQELKELVAKEKIIDTEIFLRLQVVKHRKIHLQDGYANLADYCALILGMTEDQAWKRSQAVDTITDHPWAFERLKSGKTKLNQVAMLKLRSLRPMKILLRTLFRVNPNWRCRTF